MTGIDSQSCAEPDPTFSASQQLPAGATSQQVPSGVMSPQVPSGVVNPQVPSGAVSQPTRPTRDRSADPDDRADRTSPAERLARIAWARISEPGDGVAAELVTEHGHVAALEGVRLGDLARDRPFADRLREVHPEAELTIAERLRSRIVAPGDDEWPDGLDALTDPPHVLWVRGDGFLRDMCRRSVSVVGARAATHYGVQVASDLAAGMAERGFTVVSGAAFGIDAAAHRGALVADGGTVAALACGIDRAYPTAHARLLEQIAASGAVLTELPPGQPPYASRFLLRNRLIAAVSLGTVVVEAGLRSGSLNTVRTAIRLDRYVAAVPGPVTSAVSAGCHMAIRELGATLVTDAPELAELLGRIGEDLAPPKRTAGLDDSWSDGDKLVHSRVPVRSAVGLDALIDTCGLPARTVLAALGRLELSGVVRRRDDGWQKVPPPRRRSDDSGGGTGDGTGNRDRDRQADGPGPRAKSAAPAPSLFDG